MPKTKDTKTLLRYLTDVNRTLSSIRKLEEKIASQCYKLTPSYGGNGGSSGGQQISQVERFVEEKMRLEEELAKCKARLTLVDYIRESETLSGIEYELLEWLQLGGSMSEFARTHNIYKSYVYKIRDNALEKILQFVQNTPKCSELLVKC